jgi:hypothetical protein
MEMKKFHTNSCHMPVEIIEADGEDMTMQNHSYLGFICTGLYCTDVPNKRMEETITIMQHIEVGGRVTEYTSGADPAQAYSKDRYGSVYILI